jgi:hypothetical protein
MYSDREESAIMGACTTIRVALVTSGVLYSDIDSLSELRTAKV